MIRNGRLSSIAATSQLTTSLDRAQQAAGHGPCLEAISVRKRFAATIYAPMSDGRDCTFRYDCRGAQRFVLSNTHSRGYRCDVESFRVPSRSLRGRIGAVGAMLSDHAAIALINDKRERQFKAALASRDVIGQAKGMIMERFGVDAPRAFAMLTAISQETNTPVRDLAARLVDCAKL